MVLIVVQGYTKLQEHVWEEFLEYITTMAYQLY